MFRGNLFYFPFRSFDRREIDTLSFSYPPSVNELVLPVEQAPPFPAPHGRGCLKSSSGHPFDFSFGWPTDSCLGDNITMAARATRVIFAENSIHCENSELTRRCQLNCCCVCSCLSNFDPIRTKSSGAKSRSFGEPSFRRPPLCWNRIEFSHSLAAEEFKRTCHLFSRFVTIEQLADLGPR